MSQSYSRDVHGFGRLRHVSRSCFVALAFISISIGCHSAMSMSHPADEDGNFVKNTFPLKFKFHNFASRCYNVIGCKVLYGGTYNQHNDDNEVSPPPPPDIPYFLKNMTAFRGGIKNFPPPAVVTWRSLDGVFHQANIDMSEIFKDQNVLHHVSEKDIPTETAAIALSGPNIILIVNDRTISVYMRAMIFLKKPSVSSNPLSNFVEEPILAYSHTY